MQTGDAMCSKREKSTSSVVAEYLWMVSIDETQDPRTSYTPYLGGTAALLTEMADELPGAQHQVEELFLFCYNAQQKKHHALLWSELLLWMES